MSSVSDLAARFDRSVKRYRNCCIRIEQPRIASGLKVTDIELVYASSFLSVVTQWESFLVDVIYEAVCGGLAPGSKVKRRVSVESRRALDDILLYPGKKYIAVSDVEDAERLCGLFVRDAAPINGIQTSQRTIIKQAKFIRNRIAHDSEHSRTQFSRHVPGVSGLPRPKRKPGAFLRHQFRRSPAQRQYEVYFAAFRRAARDVARTWA